MMCCKDETAWVAAANRWVQEAGEKGLRRLFLPAGETPRPLYADWEKHHHDFLKPFTFVQIDDIATGRAKSRFRDFFTATLPSFCGQMEFFDSGERGAQAAILGLGMNGHVAFHEPGLSSAFYSGCVKLTEVTRDVLHLSEETWGATYGLDAFRRCERILLLVRGEKKRQILEKVLSNAAGVPAAQLLTHPHLTVITDFAVDAAIRPTAF